MKNQMNMNKVTHPFWVIVNKEISDHLRSWRFLILMLIILLACIGSLYTSLTSIQKVVQTSGANETFFFLHLFTASDGALPSFIVFISFLGPLLGIALGFDAISAEQNKGTLSRVLSQPIYRDYLLNAKFVAALFVVMILFFILGFLMIGAGLIEIGIPPSADEFLRIISFLLVSVLYVAFWLNLSIFFSICFKQAATSALAGIAIWLFFSVFYNIILNVVGKVLSPHPWASDARIFAFQKFMVNLLRLSPIELYNDVTNAILLPSVRSLGPLSMEQIQGAIPSPLPIGQSLLISWPQLTGLASLALLCFGCSYLIFMRKEVRSR